MFAIRTDKRIYQRCRAIEKARAILLRHITDKGKKIPKCAYVEYGPADIKRSGFRKIEQNLPLGQYCLGHVI